MKEEQKSKPFFICRNCKGPIEEDDEFCEPEISEEMTEIFCTPDCAQDFYFEQMRSHPISFEELAKRYPDGK